MSPELKLVTAIREVTATIQSLIELGQRSAAIDVHDLIKTLLPIADPLDPNGA